MIIQNLKRNIGMNKAILEKQQKKQTFNKKLRNLNIGAGD